MNASNGISVCIVSHNAYRTFTGAGKGAIGGVEWQTSLLARWLARRGHTVTLVVWDEGGPPDEVVDGVRLLRLCKPKAGLWGVRFFHPKWTSLCAALRAANAQIYYHNCGECVTGQMALWCRRHGRALVFSAANDTDCDRRLPELTHWKDRVLYRHGLRSAARVVVQTKTQQRLLQEGFKVESTVIPMPCAGPNPAPQTGRSHPPSSRVLWVARVCAQKRPDRLMEVAAAMPETTFDVAGPHFTDAIAQKALAHAKQLPNVVIHGALPRDRVAKMYAEAAMLLCTSDYEGFPNTFLEAWSHGVPIVSTFDPDGLIAARNLGAVANSVDGLVKSIRTLLAGGSDYGTVSGNALNYFQSTHDADKILPKFEQLFVETANQPALRR
jgi:glycosyltransferase involved in cell wall biosynthesis